MSQIIEANVFNIVENYHALISMINTVEKLSALQGDYIVKRFNSKVKIAVFAAKEISVDVLCFLMSQHRPATQSN